MALLAVTTTFPSAVQLNKQFIAYKPLFLSWFCNTTELQQMFVR